MSKNWVLGAFLSLVCLVFGYSQQTGRVSAQEEKKAEDKEKKSGTVLGVVTKKGKNYIEVKAIGEAKGRKYVPHWRGGLPKDGGGLDKKMLAIFKKLKVGDRIRLEWEFEERARAVRIQVLKKSDEKE